MSHVALLLRRLWAWFGTRRRVAAQGLVEYSLILVLASIVVVGALTLVGQNINERMDNVQCQVDAAGTGVPGNCP